MMADREQEVIDAGRTMAEAAALAAQVARLKGDLAHWERTAEQWRLGFVESKASNAAKDAALRSFALALKAEEQLADELGESKGYMVSLAFSREEAHKMAALSDTAQTGTRTGAGEGWPSYSFSSPNAALAGPSAESQGWLPPEALENIIATLPPLDWEPRDNWGDYAPYPESDGRLSGVDETNSGDVHCHGIAVGEQAVHKKLRAALDALGGK